jgi:hypothetical protein
VERVEDRYYSLQNKLELLAEMYSNVYIIAVFDCCRERKDRPKTKGDDDELQTEISSGKGQALFIFGCRAGGRTPADSKLSNCIEQLTIAQVKKNNGVFNSLDCD